VVLAALSPLTLTHEQIPYRRIELS